MSERVPPDVTGHPQLRDRLGVSATWQGTWIEDDAHAIDLATQQLRLGASWTY